MVKKKTRTNPGCRCEKAAISGKGETSKKKKDRK